MCTSSSSRPCSWDSEYWFPQWRSCLARSDQPYARRQRAAGEFAKGAELGRIHYVVHHRGVTAGGGVFQHAAQTEIRAVEVESPFETGAEGKIVREAQGAGRAHHLPIGVHCIEGKTGLPVKRVDEIPTL